ncbi:MAG TPA: LLM class F420-dependent oxidoreductase [Chloroflexota bacterium]
MKLGLFAVNEGPCLDPAVAARIAQQAEATGFESLWVGEHVVLPDPRVAPSPMEPTDPIHDPLISLTFLAAVTSSVLLGTGIIILPQRNPLVLAKQIASLDVLSGGRVIFGIGAGYLQPEFEAVGVPFANHGPRTDEYLAAMRALWSDDHPSYAGRFVAFDNVNAYPRPVQKLVHTVVGGRSAGALKRSVEQAHGWYGYRLDHEATQHMIASIRDAEAKFQRPAELGRLEVSITPPRMTLDAAAVNRYADLGVDRLIIRPWGIHTADELTRFVADVGRLI